MNSASRPTNGAIIPASRRPFAAPTTYPHSQGFVTIFKLGEAGIRRVDEFASELPYLMPPPFKE